jgi:hypothetical protein
MNMYCINKSKHVFEVYPRSMSNMYMHMYWKCVSCNSQGAGVCFSIKKKINWWFSPEQRKISQIQNKKTRFCRISPFLLKNQQNSVRRKKHCLWGGKCRVKPHGVDNSDRRGVLGPRVAPRWADSCQLIWEHYLWAVWPLPIV